MNKAATEPKTSHPKVFNIALFFSDTGIGILVAWSTGGFFPGNNIRNRHWILKMFQVELFKGRVVKGHEPRWKDWFISLKMCIARPIARPTSCGMG